MRGEHLPGSDFTVPGRNAGALFGDSIRDLKTPSFRFNEMWATVPEREVPRHTHDAPHFIFVTGGLYITEAKNQNGFCSAGTLIFNPGGTTHRDRFSSKTGRFLSIGIEEKITQMLPDVPDAAVISGPGSANPANATLMNLVLKEWRQDRPCSLVLEGLGLELIGLRYRAKICRSRDIPHWLLKTQEMIEDSFKADFGIADLAACAGVHPVYLARAYRRHFGCSPGEYLRYCRLRRVKDFLTATDLPLVQIALECGFGDQSQMTRSFSESFGTSPARYRWLLRRSSDRSN